MIEERNPRPEPSAGRSPRPRRSFLAALGAAGVGLSARGRRARAQSGDVVTDAAILNFALNLEYLEAEFYTYAVTGVGIDAAGIPITGSGTPGPTTVKPNPQVPFTIPVVQQFASELAIDERTHVLDLRLAIEALGARPIAKPAIDLMNSFNLASQLAGLGDTFDPFANDVNFLLGAYIFEDVGVTAYHGAAPLIKNPLYLSVAAGIYAVEGYHAGAIRTLLSEQDQGPATQAISTVRATASGAPDDYGVAQGPNGNGPAGTTSIILDDTTGQAFARSFRQVLNIVYLSPNNPTSGGFFPAGVNGSIQ